MPKTDISINALTHDKTFKERPIIFNSEMVRAILDGRKTQTRRPEKYNSHFIDSLFAGGISNSEKNRLCPFGEIGDRLWVRETWQTNPDHTKCIYKADYLNQEYIFTDPDIYYGWTPSIHMPRWASRIDLEITNIRVERVQEITEEDAKAEGTGGERYSGQGFEYCIHRESFRTLWKSIYSKKYPWDSNPWVWVIEFRRIKP